MEDHSGWAGKADPLAHVGRAAARPAPGVPGLPWTHAPAPHPLADGPAVVLRSVPTPGDGGAGSVRGRRASRPLLVDGPASAAGTSDGRRQLAISADGGVSSSAGLSGELVGSQAATPDVAARWTPDDLSAAQTALINIESIEESAFDRPSSGARPYEAVIDTIFGDPEQDGDLADRSHVAVAAATAHLRAIAAGREEEGDLSLDGLLDAALTSTSSSAGPRVVTPGSLLSSLLPRGPPSFRRALPGPARSLRPRVGLFDAPLCSPQGVAAWTELFTRALGSGRFLHLEEGVRTLLNRTPGASERLGVPLRVRTPSGRAVRPGVLPPGHHPDHHCSAIGIAAGGVRFSAGGARHADHIARAVPTGFDDVVESALAGTPLPVTRVVYDDVTSFPIR